MVWSETSLLIIIKHNSLLDLKGLYVYFLFIYENESIQVQQQFKKSTFWLTSPVYRHWVQVILAIFSWLL